MPILAVTMFYMRSLRYHNHKLKVPMGPLQEHMYIMNRSYMLQAAKQLASQLPLFLAESESSSLLAALYTNHALMPGIHFTSCNCTI